MVTAAAVAHFLSLNKAITLLASNISIPPMIPLILYTALALGHWMFTGEKPEFDFSPSSMTRARALEYLWQWLAGSVVLAAFVAGLGTLITYCIARLVWKK